MARISIYLTEELKERIDAEPEPVNWSQVAADSFERKLGELAARRQHKTADDVVQRLRASRRKHRSDEGRRGREAGRRWAGERAEWPELERVAAMVGGRGWRAGGASPFGLGYDLLSIVQPEAEHDPVSAGAFWKEQAGDEDHTDDFVLAFFEGATEVFDEVRELV